MRLCTHLSDRNERKCVISAIQLRKKIARDERNSAFTSIRERKSARKSQNQTKKWRSFLSIRTVWEINEMCFTECTEDLHARKNHRCYKNERPTEEINPLYELSRIRFISLHNANEWDEFLRYYGGFARYQTLRSGLGLSNTEQPLVEWILVLPSNRRSLHIKKDCKNEWNAFRRMYWGFVRYDTSNTTYEILQNA